MRGVLPHAGLSAEFRALARRGIDSDRLREALRLAARWDVTPVEALLASGLASAPEVYRAAAAEAGLPFREAGGRVHPFARFPEAVLSGIAPLEREGGGLAYLLAPRGEALADMLRRPRSVGAGYAVTTPDALRDAVFESRGDTIARQAAEDLVRRQPEDSFHDGATLGQLVACLLGALLLGIGAGLFGGNLLAAGSLLLGLPFLGLAALKLAAVTEPVPVGRSWRAARIPDPDLPIYTILVPLYRERRVLPKLVAALSRFDYPAAKLDVKILIEADDAETRDAIRHVQLPPFFEVVTVPHGAPRTKPRALNVGLALARGQYVVVYDAEDVPEPGQLRDAVSTFAAHSPDVACLQARLVIDNTADSWLTRFFTVEYGALFDVVNPALARFDLPVPLGGTSNHLKVEPLRRLGGWDAWNVTEDADLAIRLACAGLRVADLPSATLEEAPARLRSWMAQRSRWMKGLLQVTITHSRRPLRNLGRLGLARMLGAIAVIFGAVASAIVYPVFTVILIWQTATGSLFWPDDHGEIWGTAFAATLLAAGLLAMTLPGFAAIARRRWWALWPCALLMPAYYLLVSVGAWRGLIELALDPDRWNKTEHGLARTSRAKAVSSRLLPVPVRSGPAGPWPPRPVPARH